MLIAPLLTDDTAYFHILTIPTFVFLISFIMPDYLPEEIMDMTICLGASGNFRQAARIYAQ